MRFSLSAIVFVFFLTGLYLKFDRSVSEVDPKAEAVEWYRKAAEKGQADAQFYLGGIYHRGLSGVEKDLMEGEKWYRKAAEQGQAQAQHVLGLLYYQGEGAVKKDLAEAAKWFHGAANSYEIIPYQKKKQAFMQFNLGHMYEYGEGVPQDGIRAMELYRKAAEKGQADAQWVLGVHYDIGELVAVDMTEAIKWYNKSAEQGCVAAQSSLGLLYDYREGDPEDDVLAYAWLSLAVENGESKEELLYLAEKLTEEQKNAGKALMITFSEKIAVNVQVAAKEKAAVDAMFKSAAFKRIEKSNSAL